MTWEFWPLFSMRRVQTSVSDRAFVAASSVVSALEFSSAATSFDPASSHSPG